MTTPIEQIPPPRQQMASDPYRPLYHFSPPANYLGDPNGTIFWKGKYHLFYQYNPDGAFDDSKRMHWGHAVSEDLVHWNDLPIALAPTPGGPDQSGCWSGGAVNNNGVPTLIYYGHPEGNCIAVSDDTLITWEKHPANPVIPYPLEGDDWRPFDPCAWQEGDTWYSLSGGKLEGVGDTAFLCQSKDLVSWEYMHPFYVSELDKAPESDCAVPDFFPLGDKYMLLFASHERGVQYYIGIYANHRFYPEQHGRMNFGEFGVESGHLCAGFTLLDGLNRRIFFGWIPEGRRESVQRAAGWAGVMSLPRVLSLSDNGTLEIEPVPELAGLRRNHRRLTNLPIRPDTSIPLEGVEGDCLEILATFEPGDAEALGVKVRCSPDDNEQTLIFYSPGDKSLALDAEQSSLNPDVVSYGVQRGPLELAADEPLKLRIFLDRSVVEVFANNRQCLTKRIYPARKDSRGVQLFARGGSAKLRSIDVWQMAAIWHS